MCLLSISGIASFRKLWPTCKVKSFGYPDRTKKIEKNFQAFTEIMLKRILLNHGSNTISLNIERTRTSFFEHRTNSNVFIYWWLNSNTSILASNEQTLNIEPKRPSLDLLNHPSNRLERYFFEHLTDSNMVIFW